jgi:2-succinyl-6-hydroxy-2,4-cyclohexadiene-1-carboxylate synthase
MFKFNTLTCGDPRHPPLIFLHGFLGGKEDWGEMFPFFEKEFFCIAFDLPGHRSTPYCDQILSALKIAIHKICSIKPILIGYSMGGRIALQLQECAAAMVILSAHTGLATRTEREHRRQIDKQWQKKLITLPFDTLLAEWYAQPIFHSFSLSQQIVKRRMKQNPKDLARVMQQLSLADQPHITEFLCPTLFIYGEEDLKYRELYCKLPKTVSVRSIKKCSHCVHLENAPDCAKEILNWAWFKHG